MVPVSVYGEQTVGFHPPKDLLHRNADSQISDGIHPQIDHRLFDVGEGLAGPNRSRVDQLEQFGADGGILVDYAGEGQELKDVAKQQDFVALLQAVHKKLGNLRSTVPQGWNVNYQTSGTFVTLGYATHYAEGDASEQFVYRIKDGKALLVGYNINSNALILK